MESTDSQCMYVVQVSVESTDSQYMYFVQVSVESTDSQCMYFVQVSVESTDSQCMYFVQVYVEITDSQCMYFVRYLSVKSTDSQCMYFVQVYVESTDSQCMYFVRYLWRVQILNVCILLGICGEYRFSCGDGAQCYKESEHCNGIVQCNNKADERGCCEYWGLTIVRVLSVYCQNIKLKTLTMILRYTKISCWRIYFQRILVKLH